MEDEQAGGTPPPSTESTGRQLSVWHWLSVLVVMGALVGVTFFVVHNVHNTADSATGVLGVIVPVFASVGGSDLWRRSRLLEFRGFLA